MSSPLPEQNPGDAYRHSPRHGVPFKTLAVFTKDCCAKLSGTFQNVWDGFVEQSVNDLTFTCGFRQGIKCEK